MTKTNNKLTLVNFDLKGNQTIIRSKYTFIIKTLAWLAGKEYISIEYISPEPEVKLNITSTPSSVGLPIRIKKILEKKSNLEKGLEKRAIKIDKILRKRAEGFKPAGKKLPVKKSSKKNGSK